MRRDSIYYNAMGFDKLVEQKIQEAMADGEFDNLAGKGKPLDLSDYFATPEDKRLGYSILKSAGFIPEQAQRLKEIEALRERLQTCGEAERAGIKREIDRAKLKIDLLLERRKR